MKVLKILGALALLFAPAFAHADPISAVIAIATIAESAAGAAALVAGTITLGTVAAGVAFAGGAIMAVGAITKDKNLEKIGGVMSAAGAVGGLVADAAQGVSNLAAASTPIEGAGGDVNVDPHDLQMANGGANATSSMGGEGSAAASPQSVPGSLPAAPPTSPDFGGAGTDASAAGPAATPAASSQLAQASSQGGGALTQQAGATSAAQASAINAPQAGQATTPNVQAPNVQGGAAVGAPKVWSGPGSQEWFQSYGGMTPGSANGASASAAGSGAPGSGLIDKGLNFVNQNPGIANMAGQTLGGMAQGHGQLAAAQYQNQAYMAMQQRFSDSITGMSPVKTYIKPGGMATFNGAQGPGIPPSGLINGNQG